MATRMIFSLGGHPGRETSYEMDGEVHQAAYAAIATRAFYDRRAACEGFPPIEKTYVLVTDLAYEKVFPHFAQEWGADGSLEVVRVPDGGSLDELWQIFDVVAERVQDGDRLILDVTHGLRHMPILLLMVASYLKAARSGAELAMVTYGALEAKNAEGHAPMFDLTPMIALFDWSAAVHQFDRSGDAQMLADLVKEANQRVQTQATGGGSRPKHLSAIAGIMPRFVEGLKTFRYADVLHQAHQLQWRLREAADHAPDRETVRPLFIMRDKLERSLEPFLGGDSDEAIFELLQQHRLLDWLMDRDQTMPYVALFEETLTSHAMRWLNLAARAEASSFAELRQVHAYATGILAGASAEERGEQAYDPKLPNSSPMRERLQCLDPADLRAELRAHARAGELFGFYGRVKQLRNSLMHAGFSSGDAPADATRLIAEVRKLHQEFMALGLMDSEVKSPAGA